MKRIILSSKEFYSLENPKKLTDFILGVSIVYSKITKNKSVMISFEKNVFSIKEIIVEVPVEVERESDPVNDINEATYQLRLVADELCRSLSDFMSKMTVGEQCQVSADKKTEIFDDVSAYIEETAKEIFVDTDEGKEKPKDKVKNILDSSVNFSFFTENSVCSETNEDKAEGRKNILDCLNSYSFLG